MTAARAHVLCYPPVTSGAALNDLLIRLGWHFRASAPQITIPLADGVTIPKDITWPKAIAADVQAGCAWLKERLTYLYAPDPTHIAALAQKSDVILQLQDPTPMAEALFGTRPVFVVDPMRTQHEGSHYVEAAFTLQEHTKAQAAIYQRRFEVLAQDIGTPARAWVLATGPSIETYRDFDFDDALVIGCNSIIKNETLVRNTGMQFLVCADPVFHFGVSHYAGTFREMLAQRTKAHGLTIFMPLRYCALMGAHYPDLAKHIIGIPSFGQGPFNLSLTERFALRSTHNILTFLQLPLATSFAREIKVLGCDGRPLSESDYFWQHSDTAQLSSEMQSVQDTHAAFFEIDYNGYYQEHCDRLAELIATARARDIHVSHMAPSHIPAFSSQQSDWPDQDPVIESAFKKNTNKTLGAKGNMDFHAQFLDLKEQGKIDEAIAFCTKMQREFPEFSYYKYWQGRLERLKSGGSTAPIVAPTSASTISGASSAEATGSTGQGGHSAKHVAPPVSATSASGSASMSSSVSQTRPSALVSQLGTEITQAFAPHAYVTPKHDPVTDLEAERSRLIKALPFNGDIYLPTSAISLADQVTGLTRALDMASQANRDVSRDRWGHLKRIIRETGKNRVFVIGNGPSLKQTDLALLKDEITIGFNGIFLYEGFTPTIHVVEDHLVGEDRVNEITDYRCPAKIFPAYLSYCLPTQDNTIFLNHLPRRSFPVDTDFSDDVGEISYTGGTVTYTGLQIAASLGVDEIYLIGVDASYTVHNVQRSTDYDVGVLTSTADDTNHFDGRYFGKGYRWHDPNVHTMLQAYRKARNYSDAKGITLKNATIGGQLEVFPRTDFYQLFDKDTAYPRTAVVDFTHVDWLCATGIVKKNMFQKWARNACLHLHSQNPKGIQAFQTVPNDCYSQDVDQGGFRAALRSVLEYAPDVLYLRPTHDRPALGIMQMMLPAILQRPYVIHYMDDWMAKLERTKGAEFAEPYQRLMRLLFARAAKVLTISQKMADFLERDFGVRASRLQVVHNFIQDQPVGVTPGNKQERVLRYFGGMEPDMALASIRMVAEAVEKLNANSSTQSVRFEIFTSPQHIEKNAATFEKYGQTTLFRQMEDYDVYLSLLHSSDINLLCYNFDEVSEEYLRYSMANKLPEIIGAARPFVAIGSTEIGTLTFLKEEKYPFVLAENDGHALETMLQEILFEGACNTTAYGDAFTRLKEEFSPERNRHGFQATLRQVAATPGNPFTDDDLVEINAITERLYADLGDKQANYPNLALLKTLLSEDAQTKTLVAERIHKHGLAWQFKLDQKQIETILDQNLSWSDIGQEERVLLLCYMIVSLQHERFTMINSRISALLP